MGRFVRRRGWERKEGWGRENEGTREGGKGWDMEGRREKERLA